MCRKGLAAEHGLSLSLSRSLTLSLSLSCVSRGLVEVVSLQVVVFLHAVVTAVS